MMYIFAAMPIGGALLGIIALEQMLRCILWAIDPATEPGDVDEHHCQVRDT